jgi:hypothetical protein
VFLPGVVFTGYPFSPQPTRQCLDPTCHLSALNYNTVSRRVLATIGENEENNVDGNKVKSFQIARTYINDDLYLLFGL